MSKVGTPSIITSSKFMLVVTHAKLPVVLLSTKEELHCVEYLLDFHFCGPFILYRLVSSI